MCREDEEAEVGCECDFCIGYAIGYNEGDSGGFRRGMNKANTFHGLSVDSR